jgi:hypothetical protein
VCDNEGQSCQQREDRIRIVADTDQWANVEDRDEEECSREQYPPGNERSRSAVLRSQGWPEFSTPIIGFPPAKQGRTPDRVFGNSRPALIVNTVG